jgi:hypothetical protein
MKTKQDVAEIIADALDKCVPGSVGFRNLSGCHRDRLLSKAIAAINAVQEAGYVIRRERQRSTPRRGTKPDTHLQA